MASRHDGHSPLPRASRKVCRIRPCSVTLQALFRQYRRRYPCASIDDVAFGLLAKVVVSAQEAARRIDAIADDVACAKGVPLRRKYPGLRAEIFAHLGADGIVQLALAEPQAVELATQFVIRRAADARSDLPSPIAASPADANRLLHFKIISVRRGHRRDDAEVEAAR